MLLVIFGTILLGAILEDDRRSAQARPERYGGGPTVKQVAIKIEGSLKGIPHSFQEVDQTTFEWGAPAPAIAKVRGAVHRAAQGQPLLISEERRSPGAVGEGWTISITGNELNLRG